MALSKITGFPLQDTGVGFYRIVQPLRFLKRTGLVKEARMTPFSGANQPVRIANYNLKLPTYNDKLLMKIAKGTDVLWSTVIFDELQIKRMLDLRKWSGAKWIVDIDDNLYDVTRDNPGEAPVKAASRNVELCLSLADGITVSTENLKELYSHLNPNIFVIPNGVDPLEWKYKRSPKDKIRIGWRGSYGHQQDLNLIESVLKEITNQYDVEFVTFGVRPLFTLKNHLHADWVELQKYPESLAELNFDIAVVPLINSNYNQCKSNIAILEHSMLESAVVASPVANQKGFPIMYAESNYEWYDCLSKLIESEKLRKSQTKEQKKFVLDNYNPGELVKPLIDWIEKLPRKDLDPKIV